MAQTSQRKCKRETEVNWKPDLSSKIPVRLTSCIFQKPVTRIVCFPGNEVRRGQYEEQLENPQQAYIYMRLQGLQACSSTGEPLKAPDFKNVLKRITPSGGGMSLGCVDDKGPFMFPITSPEQYFNVAVIAPGLGLSLSRNASGQLVTSGDTRKQAQKVKKARERLALALRAERLAREAEATKSQQECPEN
ncbi:PREDICTED: putative methyl-CpG-binding domain protein 3-like 5-like [Elephantulus edwardii]|uniref:putative methyl-CpG-binding domain protein 3-like 5-like n=1 Tax=Elephantulus edwardii TaxID=28737 RepID=UPI0003F0ED07|nr:PREDICTED: putative methyl-CpG-binding domain protein 3-like 5-like [Elephantulus edwardii]